MLLSHSAAFAVVSVVGAALLVIAVSPADAGVSQHSGEQQQQCSGATDSGSESCSSHSQLADDGSSSQCRDWASSEAAAERVPDWLERLRRRHPCPADAKAATAAVDTDAWQDDFCCSRHRNSWVLVSAATGWLKRWLCGGPSCHYHAGADFCVRSPSLPLPDGTAAGQQCCYHGSTSAGRLLTDPTTGSGTADRRADSVFGHWSEDVKPFLACCQAEYDGTLRVQLASPLCAVYFNRRPPNVGSAATSDATQEIL